MTKVGNTRAYSEEKETIQKEIEQGVADFAVAVFDINLLKPTNDNYGHQIGDILIRGTAEVLKKTFAHDNIYRIGGDEFAVIFYGATSDSIEILFNLLDCETKRFNASQDSPVPLTISKGYSLFDAACDKDFRDVFARADHNMYAAKE